MKAGTDGREVRVSGTVMVYERDANEQVCAVLITADDKVDYVVREGAAVRQLLRYLGVQVSAEGTAVVDSDGETTLVLTQFRVPDEEDADDFDQTSTREEMPRVRGRAEDWPLKNGSKREKKWRQRESRGRPELFPE